jgi:uncharacterized membrane protein YoaK (UPF0700 family)
MLIRFGKARDHYTDRRLAWSLAAVAGALNTAGFHVTGLFTSNMTGNVSALANNLATTDVRLAATYLSLVAVFVAGATASTLMINAGRRHAKTDIYAVSIIAEAGLLAALAGLDLWLAGSMRAALLAYGLSFLMGLQNAVVTRISDARIRTTHVTGMLTDIGIELGTIIDHRRHGDPEHAAAISEKLRLHGVAVLSFLAGGIVGVLAFDRFGAFFLFATALLLVLLALPGVVRAWAASRHHRRT